MQTLLKYKWLHLSVSSCGNGITDSPESLIPWNHWFQNFWKGTHVKRELVIPGISDSDSKIFGKWIPFLHLIYELIWNTFWAKIGQFDLNSVLFVTFSDFGDSNRYKVSRKKWRIVPKYCQNWPKFWPKRSQGHLMCDTNPQKILESVIPGDQWFRGITDSKTTWVPFKKFWNQWFQGISDSGESLIPFPHEDTATMFKNTNLLLWNA